MKFLLRSLINQQIAHEETTYQASIQYQQKQQELRDKIAILDIEAGKDEEILIRETTIKDAHDNFYEVSVYLKLQAYHQLDWIERLVVDQLNPGEVLLHSEYK